jgi:hypothetical protein
MALTYVNMTPLATGDVGTWASGENTWYPSPGGTHWTNLDEGVVSPNTPVTVPGATERLDCYGTVDHLIEMFELAPGVPANTGGEVRELRVWFYSRGLNYTAVPGLSLEIWVNGVQVGETKTVNVQSVADTRWEVFFSSADATPFVYDAATWRAHALSGDVVLKLIGVDGEGYELPVTPPIPQI